jgi:hypothetical protein
LRRDRLYISSDYRAGGFTLDRLCILAKTLDTDTRRLRSMPTGRCVSARLKIRLTPATVVKRALSSAAFTRRIQTPDVTAIRADVEQSRIHWHWNGFTDARFTLSDRLEDSEKGFTDIGGNVRGTAIINNLEGISKGLSLVLPARLLEDDSGAAKVVSSALIFAVCENIVGGNDEPNVAKESGEECSDGVKLGFGTLDEGKRSQSGFLLVE